MESDIISPRYSVEVNTMAYLLCSSCKARMQIEIPAVGNGVYDPIRVIGSAICRQCKAGTGFEIENNVITYVSGAKSYGILNGALSETVKTLYAEAELSFQSGASNASTSMCRASIESALTEKEIQGNNLFEQINNAKKILSDVEIGLAHACRLITTGAIHRGELIALADVPAILSATVRILNKLAS
ncbi:MAG: hypothetical protein HYX84_03720 [Chloroflexi bacterium]|nr:hypothetical protein [Chloroflexota bacterium]